MKYPGTKCEDLRGQVYGRLTVIDFDSSTKSGSKWRVKCECGKELIVYSNNFRRGTTSSCGCLQLERTSASNTRHGHRKTKATKTYAAWSSMKERCKPGADFKNYASRGITVCERWQEFPYFVEDMGECPEGFSIEREDVNGNYCKENCAWLELKLQASNRTTSIRLVFEGSEYSLPNLARKYGLTARQLYDRHVRNGWDLAKALRKPVRNAEIKSDTDTDAEKVVLASMPMPY